MANQLYPKFVNRLITSYLGVTPVAGDTAWKVYLLDVSYVFQESHETIADLVGVVGAPITLANVTIADGIVDADDVIDAFVGTGPTPIAALVVTVDDQLTAFYNEGVLATLPIVSEGIVTNIIWNELGIFRV